MLFADIDLSDAGKYAAPAAVLLWIVRETVPMVIKWKREAPVADAQAVADARIAEAAAEKAKAEANKAKIEADEPAIQQYRRLSQQLELRTRRLQEQVDENRSEMFTVKAELQQVKAGHHDCEERSKKQETKISGLESQNAQQQGTIDSLTSRLTRLFQFTGADGQPGIHTPPPSDSPPRG